MAAAARVAACDLHAALLRIEESGAAEYTSGEGSWRHRRYREEDDSGDGFAAGEVFARSLTLSHWRQPDDSAVTFGELPFTEAEVCPADALVDMEPDEQHFQEATGNEGASFERSCQRAALAVVLAHLVQLQDGEQIDTMLAGAAAGTYGAEDNAAIVQALKLLPAPRVGQLLQALVQANADLHIGGCADLLARASAVPAWRGGLRGAAMVAGRTKPSQGRR